jgi:hypothetical protein
MGHIWASSELQGAPQVDVQLRMQSRNFEMSRLEI